MQTAFAIVIAGVLIAGAIFFAGSSPPTRDNVHIVDGKQFIDVTAKGKYYPKRMIAKAGVPTVLRMNTSGTFDCTAAFTIPSMRIEKFLPPMGTTEIDLGSPRVGTLQGVCGMGMYSFEIDFEG